MNRPLNYIQEHKAAFFDWLVFTISLSLGFIYPSLKEFISSYQFSNWMLAALLFYTAGICLKHAPLSYRLRIGGQRPANVPLILFLVIGHWVIMLFVVIFSEPAFRRIFRLPKIDPNKSSDGWMVFGSIVMTTFLTWLAFRGIKKIKNIHQLSAARLARTEMIADVLLIAGVSILSFVFWEKGVLALLTAKPTSSLGDVWFMFIFLSICYILFYLPLRYLFLLEDHSSRQTWKRLLLIFGLLLLKSLFEMLKI